MGSIFGLVSPLYYLCDPCACKKSLTTDIHRDEILADSSKALCRSSRIHTVPKRYEFLINEQNDILLIEDDKRTTYEEYLNSSKSDKWLISMKSKMDSMYENQVWTLVDLPEEIKPIG